MQYITCICNLCALESEGWKTLGAEQKTTVEFGSRPLTLINIILLLVK
jgi:hypothetical protein